MMRSIRWFTLFVLMAGAAFAQPDLTQFDADGVQFAYDATFVPNGISVVNVPVNADDETPDYLRHPDYLIVQFGMDSPRSEYDARLYVYPLAAYKLLNPYIHDDSVNLRSMLDDQPALNDFDTLPHIGHLGSAQLINAAAAYLPFNGGSGFRYLAAYAQATAPITSTNLTYVYQGMSDDGQYLISLSLPLTASFLTELNPLFDWDVIMPDESGQAYREYRDEVIALLESAAPDDFEPSLVSIDALARSLTIDSTALAETVADPEQFGRYKAPITTWDIAACESGAFPIRLSSGEGARQILPAQYSTGLYDVPGGAGIGQFLESGGVVVVLDGPACFEGRNFWLVSNGIVNGWTAESGFSHADEKETYFLEPHNGADVPLMPSTPPDQSATGCLILPLNGGSVYERPNTIGRNYGRLSGDLAYYADEFLQSPDGGYGWWRIPAGATIRVGGGVAETTTQSLWINAEEVNEMRGCERLLPAQ
jgi:hypothetical protein